MFENYGLFGYRGFVGFIFYFWYFSVENVNIFLVIYGKLWKEFGEYFGKINYL